MSILDKYFTGNCSISLENVTYNKLDEIEGNVTLSVKDDLKIKENISNTGFIDCIISRNLSFVPKSLVDITVSFGISLELNEKCKKTNTLDYDTLKKHLISEDSVIASIVMSRISLLISQLTSSYGERPIITPPSFMTEN
ncbi:MAG: hypothetical protein ACI4E1_12140 [Lachnospira sp.]